MMFDVLYTKTVKTKKVHHVQVDGNVKQEALQKFREGWGNKPYIISFTPHEDDLNDVHPDYY